MAATFISLTSVLLIFSPNFQLFAEAAVRLPTHLTPSSYEVRLLPHVDPAQDWRIDGYVKIHLNCGAAARNVTLHAKEIDGITVDTVKVTRIVVEKESAATFERWLSNDTLGDSSVSGRDVSVGVTGVEYQLGDDFVIITLDEEVIPGEKYALEITSFTATLNDKLVGFYRSQYTHQGSERWMGVTQFQTGDARRAFPCFDEPGLKATFDITLGRPATDGWMTLSNMDISATQPIDGMEGEYEWDIFNTTPLMSTYLVAFCISQFEHVVSSTDSRVKVWTRPDMLNRATFPADEAGKILKVFETDLGIPYPLSKMDLIALTDFPYGAMENWGLITFREQYLVLDTENKTSSAAATDQVISILAHEIAHQWFGNLATPQWWNDLWLSEGFACYFDYYARQKVRPGWSLMDVFTVLETQDDLRTDALASASPVFAELDEHEAVKNLKVCKGSPLLHMLRNQLGDSTFMKGVVNYLMGNQYSLVETKELWTFFQAAAEEDAVALPGNSVEQVMSSWVKKPGAPVVTLTRHDDNTATISQERFLLLNNGDEDPSNETSGWFVLLNFNVDESGFNQTKALTWMLPSEQTKLLTAENLPTGLESWVVDESRGNWVIINSKQTGFYRVNYDPANWRMIQQQLAKMHTLIPAENRAQLLDDAFYMARANLLDYPSALGLTSYLGKETEYAPWRAAMSQLGYLDQQLIENEGYLSFRDYMHCLIGPLYTALETLEETPASYDDLDVVEVWNRNDIQSNACRFGWLACLEDALGQYNAWMESYPALSDPDIPMLSPNAKTTIYCYGVRSGGDAEYEHAWNHYRKTNIAAERTAMLRAISSSNNQTHLERYLNSIFASDSSIRSQDKTGAFRYLAANIPTGRRMAFDYLVDNFDFLLANFSEGVYRFSDFISAFSTFNTREAAEQLRELRDSHAGNLAGAGPAFDQTIESIEANLRWAEQHLSEVVAWFDGATIDGGDGLCANFIRSDRDKRN